LEIDALRYFVRTLEMESISRAAVTLGITQPALSRQIRRLESELGKLLLVRNGRGVKATESGRYFATEAMRILEDVDALGEAMSSEASSPAGSVALALPSSISDGLLPQLLAIIDEKFPDIQIKVTEALSSISSELLRSRTVDLAIQYERADMASLVCEKLIDEPLCLISAPDNAVGLADVVDFSTVELLKLILPSQNSGLRRMLDMEAAQRNLRLNVAVEIESVSAMKNLAAAGLGHCILPQLSVAREVAAGTLVTNLIGEPRLKRGLVISRLALRNPSIAMIKVMQAVREVAELYA
jgi:LysR family nitrogen assimilation transcriptional regulator